MGNGGYETKIRCVKRHKNTNAEGEKYKNLKKVNKIKINACFANFHRLSYSEACHNTTLTKISNLAGEPVISNSANKRRYEITSTCHMWHLLCCKTRIIKLKYFDVFSLVWFF